MTPSIDTGDDVLFVLNGLERSGTIWTTRLLADSLQVAARSSYNEPPFTHEDDPAVWHLERQGKFIRRLHAYVRTYPYDHVPCVLTMRDPRDLAVSRLEVIRGEETTEAYDAEAVHILPLWLSFHAEWNLDKRRITTVHYEDLVRNPCGEVRRILMALDLPFGEEFVERAVREHEFSVMDNLKKGNHGRGGAWRDKLSRQAADHIWDCYGEAMQVFGYGAGGYDADD